MAQLILNTNLRLSSIPANLATKLSELLATILEIDSSRIFICIVPNTIMSVGSQSDGFAAITKLTIPDDGPEVEPQKLTELLSALASELPEIPARRWVITLNRCPGFIKMLIEFDSGKYIQKITKLLRKKQLNIPSYECNYSFAIVNELGILFLVSEDGTIYRKLHTEMYMVSTKLNISLLNEILPTFNPFTVILLIGNSSIVNFTYCYRDLFEKMTKRNNDNNDDPLNETLTNSATFNPIFIYRPLYFFYGEFVENSQNNYSDSTIALGCGIRLNGDPINSFEIKSNEQIHVVGQIFLRISGSKRFVHITRDMIDDNKVIFVTKIEERQAEFRRWLHIASFINGDSPTTATPKHVQHQIPIIFNPMENVPFK